MVGTVACRIVSKVHVDGRRVAQPNAVSSSNTGRRANPEENESPEQKHARVMTAEGRKVVGPKYSTCRIATGRDVVGINPRGKQEVSAAIKCSIPEASSEKSSLGGKAMRDLGGGMNDPRVSSGLGQRDTGRHTGERRVPAPRSCPSRLTKNQWRGL
jgi:hypothetical protein